MNNHYIIPVTEKQAKAYELASTKPKNYSSKEEIKKVAQEFGALGLAKWQALSLCFNYYQNDKTISVKEKMLIFKEGILNPKRNTDDEIDLTPKKAKPFWKTDTKKGRGIVIEPSDLVALLSDLGYYKFNKSKTGYIKLDGKIISEATANDMQLAVKKYLEEIQVKKLKKVKDHNEVWEFIINKKYLFRETTLSYLPNLDLPFHRDAKNEINLYLQTGYLKITSENILFKTYAELEGVVWRESTIEVPFTELNYQKSSYEVFLGNTQKNDKKRISNTMKVLGYLMHRYNFHSKMKIACFTDELISMEANGGTGKNLTLELLGFTRSMVVINGKRLNLRNRFTFQKVEDYHDVILLNDVRKNLDIEDLYSDTSEGIEVEKKGINATSKDRNTTSKFVITANYRKLVSSGSTRRRVVDVFYSDYYNYKFTVADEFQKELFNDFNQDEWNQVITFAIRCCQLYLKEGLPKSKSLEEEALEMSTPNGFVEFMDLVIQKERKIDRSTLRVRFQKESKLKVGSKEFCKWVEEFFKVRNVTTQGFINSNGKTYASKSSNYFYEIIPNK